jgi:hypothetical protein
MNAECIKLGYAQAERIVLLNQTAISQMKSLLEHGIQNKLPNIVDYIRITTVIANPALVEVRIAGCGNPSLVNNRLLRRAILISISALLAMTNNCRKSIPIYYI